MGNDPPRRERETGEELSPAVRILLEILLLIACLLAFWEGGGRFFVTHASELPPLDQVVEFPCTVNGPHETQIVDNQGRFLYEEASFTVTCRIKYTKESNRPEWKSLIAEPSAKFKKPATLAQLDKLKEQSEREANSWQRKISEAILKDKKERNPK